MKFSFFTLACVALAAAPLGAQITSSQPKGAVERVKVHGKSLEGNLAGDPAARDVSVYLPPSYATDPSRRYPVVYFLHGFTDDDARWYGLQKHWISLPDVLGRALQRAGAKEMIFVTPNAFTAFSGSMYSSSVTTGDWEAFVAQELVAYMDNHYRTIPKTASRGLAGHSMGGYGAMRIGMKNPGVFSSVYLLSPCCMTSNLSARQRSDRAAKAESFRTVSEIRAADFGTKAAFARAAAWSPNPKNPPLYLDLPWKNGEVRPEIAAKWAANEPLAMIDQYIPDIRRLSAIAFDAGDQDKGIAAAVKVLDETLNAYGVQHLFEIYQGDHTNRIADRIEAHVVPFFSNRLQFEQ